VNSGVVRFAFDVPELTDGIGFVAVAMGLFAFAEIASRREAWQAEVFTDGGDDCGRRDDLKDAAPAIARGTALGSVLGILPRAARSWPRSPPTAWRRSSPAPARTPPFGRATSAASPDRSRRTTRRADLVHPDADLGNPAQRGDGADDRRHDDPQHPRPGPQDVEQPGPVWGLIASMWVAT